MVNILVRLIHFLVRSDSVLLLELLCGDCPSLIDSVSVPV